MIGGLMKKKSLFQVLRKDERVNFVGSLNPKSKHFLPASCLSPILSHYSDILPQGNLENKISTLKTW